MDPNAFALFDDEPTAQERAAAMAQALRRRRAEGQLGVLTGDRVLGGFGQTQLQGADRQEGMLADAGRQRSGQRLQRAMQAQAQGFTAGENAKNRAASRQNLLDELAAREAAARAKAEADKATKVREVGGGLRRELMNNPVTKAAQEVSVAFDKIQRAAKMPSAAGDLSLIFSYMKLLDPGSTVREGEFANAQNATGVPGQIVNMYNRALSGERLAPEMRADFVGQAKGLYEAQISKYQQLADQYQGLAERQGAAPGDVVLDLGMPTPAEAPAGAMKTIGGKRYIQINGEWHEE